MIKSTPLYLNLQKKGAKFIPFAGWKMPLHFSSAKEEHLNVRKNVGLFDVSHMGQIRVQGASCISLLSQVFSNKVSEMQKGQSQYNLMCNENGGIIDDLIVYCIEKEKDYLICVNASNTDKNFKWIKEKNSFPQVEVKIQEGGLLALQGPKSLALLEKVLKFPAEKIQKFHFEFISFQNKELLVARTGYTGEAGFEIFCPSEVLESLWEAFFQFKDDFHLTPVGLAARDTLRLEMKYPLYGQDMDEKTTPSEMGLRWACQNPHSFIGKPLALKEPSRKWVGFEVLESSGIPRKGYNIFSKEQKIGEVTSGVLSPSLQKMIGLALVEKDFSKPGTKLFIEIHNKKVEAQVVSTPFLKKTSI